MRDITDDPGAMNAGERRLSDPSVPSYGAVGSINNNDSERKQPTSGQVIRILDFPVIVPIATSSLPAEPDDFMTRTLDKMRVIPCAGIVLSIMSGIFFATAGFIVKMIPEVNPIEIVISRSIVQLIAYLPVVLIYRMPILGVKGERTALYMRGFFGFLSFTLCYVSYRMIPLADASTIVFSAPVYVSVFACVFLKEECGIFQTVITAVTIAGVLLISKPTFIFGYQHEAVQEVALRMEGSVIALISSLSTALTFILIRKLQKTPAAVVINSFSIVSIVSGIVALALIRNLFFEAAGDLATGVGWPATAGEIGWMIGNGLCGVFGQLCLTIALKVEEASLVSLARTIDIVMAFVFQILWLPSEAVHWTSLLGAIIVCTGVCVSALRRWLREKHGKWNVLWYIINCGMDRPGKDEMSDKPYIASRSISFVDPVELSPRKSIH